MIEERKSIEMSETKNKTLQLGFEVETKPEFLQSVGRQKRVNEKKIKAPQTANDLTKAAVKLLGLRGFVVWRNNNTAVYDPKIRRFRRMSTRKGVSDITGYQKKTGRAIYVEVKVGADKLSDEQREFLIEALTNGCIAFECKQIDDITRRLQQYDPLGGH